MQLRPCACDEDLYVRIPRSVWMRLLFPSRWLYYCWSCKSKMLIAPLAHGVDTTPQQQTFGV
jgi:hypothetical protein